MNPTLQELRDKPLPCFFPSCVSKFKKSDEGSSVRVEEQSGGWIAECQDCCGGTGSFESRDAALDEWNRVARAVLKASSVSEEPKSEAGSGFSQTDFTEHLRKTLSDFVNNTTDEEMAQAFKDADFEFYRHVIDKTSFETGGRNALNLQMALEEIKSVLTRIQDELNAIKTPYDSPTVEALRLLSVNMFKDMQTPLQRATDALQSAQAASDGKEQGTPRQPTKQSGPPPCAVCSRPPHPDYYGHSYRPESASSYSATVRGPMEGLIKLNEQQQLAIKEWAADSPFGDLWGNDEAREINLATFARTILKHATPSGIEGRPAQKISKNEARWTIIDFGDVGVRDVWCGKRLVCIQVPPDIAKAFCDAHNASLPDNGEAVQTKDLEE